MKRFAALFVIAILAIIILIFVNNPSLLNQVWLYVIGFIGYVVVLFEKGFKTIKGAFVTDKQQSFLPDKKEERSLTDEKHNHQILQLENKIMEAERRLMEAEKSSSPLNSYTLTVLRYMDDGETTLGLLFLRNKFFAYTLEDTHQDIKIAGETRIPAGVYPIDFNRNKTQMTLAYRRTRPWFDYHLELKSVPGYHGIYIHVGNTHKDTRGCILIADGVNASSQKSIIQSQMAYERFYKNISALLNNNEPVQIQLLNENWFERSRLATL